MRPYHDILTRMSRGNSPPAPSPFPPHVVSLAEALRPIHTKLQTERKAPFPATGSVSDLGAHVRELEKHLEIMRDFALRMEDKIHDLKREVLSNPDISKRAVHRSVAGFEEVIDNLLNECSRTHHIPTYRMDGTGRDLTIKIYHCLLSEINDWLEDFVETVADPVAAYEKRGLSMSDDVMFTFVFEPSEPPQVKELEQWVGRKAAACKRETPPVHAKSGFWKRYFWNGLRRGIAIIEQTTSADLEAAWAIGERFSDQDFSLVDRTSFALMERLGIFRVISFDSDFAVFRYGRNRSSAFDVLR